MKKLNNYSIVFVCLFLSSTVNSSLFGQCLEIESILVDACGSPEGENEMVRFRVGSTPLNTTDMTVSWPNNSWLGVCQNATTTSAVTSLNATIQSCGLLIEPTGGVLPANAQVLLVTSTAIDVNANSFANLSDTLYIIFQCEGNTSGHFANYSTPSGLRTTTISFSLPIGCTNQVTYDKVLLVNQMGGIGGSAAIRDGALANFDAFGNVTYENFGCQAPFTPISISVSAISPVNICPGNSIQVFATTIGTITSLNWQGNNGTFNSTTNDTVTYTSTLTDTTNFFIKVEGTASCGTIKDSILIMINPPATFTQNPIICQGQSFTLPNGLVVSSAGTFVDTLIGAAQLGCDSVVTTNLTINQPVSFSQSFNECQGFSVTVGSNIYNSTGIFNDTLITLGGCDSIVTTNLTINQPVSFNQSFNECQGFSVTVGSNIYNSTGIFNDTLITMGGCDSVVTTNLTINQPVSFSQSFNECQGFSVTVGSNTYNSTGIFNDTLITMGGCDSIVTTNLTINQPVSFSQSFNECQGFSVTVGSNTYNSTGIFNDTLITMGGCDSVVTTNLTINPAQQVVILEKDTTICEDESLVLHAIGANLYWSTGESTDSIIVSTEGIYSVTSLNGCQTSSSITIFQESCIVTSIFIPNVFTPNGDNQNDFFIVDGTNITGIEGVIFNRWGQQLFTWNNINVGWDGTYKNKITPDGTYFYMIKVDFLDSKKRNLQGSITLLR